MVKNRKSRIFNPSKRRILRKQISGGEAVVGVICVAATAGMGLWIAAQEDQFDPGERDISIEVLREQSVEDNLYQTPLKRWVDPAQATTGLPYAPDLGSFPAAILEGGWLVSKLQKFDAGNLYEKINGQADQYLSFGFEALEFLVLESADGEETIDIYLYDQGSFANCLGLFADQRDGDTALESMGPVHFLTTSIGAVGQVDRYFFQILGSQTLAASETQSSPLGYNEEDSYEESGYGSDGYSSDGYSGDGYSSGGDSDTDSDSEAAPAGYGAVETQHEAPPMDNPGDVALGPNTERILRALGSLADPEAAMPKAFQALNWGLGIDRAQISYRPSLAFQYEFADQFWFGRPEPDGNTRLFAHLGQTQADARLMFERMHTALLDDFELLEEGQASRLYRHRYLKTYFSLNQNGSVLFGVEDHPDRSGVAAAVAQLQTALIESEALQKDGE